MQNVVDFWWQISGSLPRKNRLQMFVTENFTTFFTTSKEICHLDFALGAFSRKTCASSLVIDRKIWFETSCAPLVHPHQGMRVRWPGMERNPKMAKRVESTPDPNTFEKYRDTPPISIAILLQKYALFLEESSIYTTNLHHDTPPICITILLQKYQRQGSLEHPQKLADK